MMSKNPSSGSAKSSVGLKKIAVATLSVGEDILLFYAMLG
jgi:hypothetical protein